MVSGQSWVPVDEARTGKPVPCCLVVALRGYIADCEMSNLPADKVDRPNACDQVLTSGEAVPKLPLPDN